MKSVIKKSQNKELVFIDTNVFITAVTSNFAKQIISEIKTKMDKDEIFLLLPEIIKKEIFWVFQIHKEDLINKITDNLTTKNIMGIEEENVDSKSRQSTQKNTKKPLNVEAIDEVIKQDREKLISNFEGYYNSIYKGICSVFDHKNTITLLLSNKVFLSGMKRSLYKMAPFTNKTTENSHTKDADCIAFESIVAYINSKKVSKNDALIMCVKDKDYLPDGVDLHPDIYESLKKIGKPTICTDISKYIITELDNSTFPTISDRQSAAEPSLAIPTDALVSEIDSSNT